MVDGVLEFGHFDYLDAHLLVCAVPLPLVYGAAVALADMLVDLV